MPNARLNVAFVSSPSSPCHVNGYATDDEKQSTDDGADDNTTSAPALVAR